MTSSKTLIMQSSVAPLQRSQGFKSYSIGPGSKSWPRNICNTTLYVHCLLRYQGGGESGPPPSPILGKKKAKIGLRCQSHCSHCRSHCWSHCRSSCWSVQCFFFTFSLSQVDSCKNKPDVEKLSTQQVTTFKTYNIFLPIFHNFRLQMSLKPIMELQKHGWTTVGNVLQPTCASIVCKGMCQLRKKIFLFYVF